MAGHTQTPTSRSKRNSNGPKSSGEDPYSEVRDNSTSKSDLYREEKRSMDGFGVKARRGVNPTDVKVGAHDVDAEESGG